MDEDNSVRSPRDFLGLSGLGMMMSAFTCRRTGPVSGLALAAVSGLVAVLMVMVLLLALPGGALPPDTTIRPAGGRSGGSVCGPGTRPPWGMACFPAMPPARGGAWTRDAPVRSGARTVAG